MTDETTTTPPAPASATPAPAPITTSTIVVTHPKDRRTFCGTDEVDVEDWIANYERISEVNRWDLTMMLANVLFYLKGTAKVWFANHAAEIGS